MDRAIEGLLREGKAKIKEEKERKRIDREKDIVITNEDLSFFKYISYDGIKNKLDSMYPGDSTEIGPIFPVENNSDTYRVLCYIGGRRTNIFVRKNNQKGFENNQKGFEIIK
jgi:hypothetical protein